MSYPKNPPFNTQPHSNRTQQPKYSESQRLALISRVSKALRLKYMPTFLSCDYKDKDLYSDVNALLTKELLSKPAKDIFASIDKSIMAIIKQRNSTRTNNHCPPLQTLPNKSITAEHLHPQISISNSSPNDLAIRDLLLNQSAIYQVSNSERHELVDNLRLKMELENNINGNGNSNNDHYKAESLEIFKQLKEKKLKQQDEMSLFLQKQIEEKEERDLQFQRDDKNFGINQIYQYKTDDSVVKQKKLKMQQDFRVSLDKIHKERRECEKKIRDQKKQTENDILSYNRILLTQDKEIMMEKQKKINDFYAELKIDRLKYMEAKKQLKTDKLKVDQHYLKQFDDVMKKREQENEEIKEKIRKQVKEKDELDKRIFAIYSPAKTDPNEEREFYLKKNKDLNREIEEEKQKRILKKSAIRKEMQTGLDEMIKVKQQEKHDINAMDMKYKEIVVADYNKFVNEQQTIKAMKKEKVRKYKAELDNQLIEKKKNQLELLKLPIYPVNYHSRLNLDF